MSRMRTPAERLHGLLSRVAMVNGCWEYQGPRRKDGYGFYNWGNDKLAHRIAYRLACGEIPKGMVVMHTCDNPPCCNPAHLKLGTKGDNNRDMFAKQRHVYSKVKYTKCKNGHEYTPETTYVTKQGFRSCKRCKLIKNRMEAGWTREQAESLPLQTPGKRPVNASWAEKKPIPRIRSFSTHGSAPRQRAWRARQREKRLANSESV
jgi:hypothetical protein